MANDMVRGGPRDGAKARVRTKIGGGTMAGAKLVLGPGLTCRLRQVFGPRTKAGAKAYTNAGAKAYTNAGAKAYTNAGAKAYTNAGTKAYTNAGAKA